jgi:hypothetical protein
MIEVTMIEVLKYEKATRNKVIGLVDVKIHLKNIEMIVRGVAHLQSGEKEWFRLPTFSKPTRDGKWDYIRYWQLEDEESNEYLLKEIAKSVRGYLENPIPF